jgi:hypothetical protein
MNRAERIWNCFVGGLLIFTGLLILFAFQFLIKRGRDTWWDIIGIALAIEAYSIVAVLFILLGFRYILGPRGFIEKSIGHSVRQFAIAAILISVIITAAGTFWLVMH